jgi:hypothetical protein
MVLRLVIVWVMMAISSGAAASDTIRVDSVKKEKELSWLRRTIRGFSYIDENYVEPQHYNWSVMALGRYTYDNYRLATVGDNGQSVSFSPRTGIKFGPYFGWRWVFLGYTIDLSNISFDFSSSRWQGIDASLYSAQIGADVFYHHTRNNYKIREVRLGDRSMCEPWRIFRSMASTWGRRVSTSTTSSITSGSPIRQPLRRALARRSVVVRGWQE